MTAVHTIHHIIQEHSYLIKMNLQYKVTSRFIATVNSIVCIVLTIISLLQLTDHSVDAWPASNGVSGVNVPRYEVLSCLLIY